MRLPHNPPHPHCLAPFSARRTPDNAGHVVPVQLPHVAGLAPEEIVTTDSSWTILHQLQAVGLGECKQFVCAIDVNYSEQGLLSFNSPGNGTCRAPIAGDDVLVPGRPPMPQRAFPLHEVVTLDVQLRKALPSVGGCNFPRAV